MSVSPNLCCDQDKEPRSIHSSDTCIVQSLSLSTLCNPMNCNIPGFPVLHHLPEFDQTQVHGVSDAPQYSAMLMSVSFHFHVLPKPALVD